MTKISQNKTSSVEHASTPSQPAVLTPVIQREFLCKDEKAVLEDELGEVVDTERQRPDRHFLVTQPEGLNVSIENGRGELSVHGAATYLAVKVFGTAFGMLAALGLVLYSSRPVSDAYVPMLLVGAGSTAVSCVDGWRRKK